MITKHTKIPKIISKVMYVITIILFMLGIWQLFTRGISFDTSSAIQFLSISAIMYGINQRKFKK